MLWNIVSLELGDIHFRFIIHSLHGISSSQISTFQKCIENGQVIIIIFFSKSHFSKRKVILKVQSYHGLPIQGLSHCKYWGDAPAPPPSFQITGQSLWVLQWPIPKISPLRSLHAHIQPKIICLMIVKCPKPNCALMTLNKAHKYTDPGKLALKMSTLSCIFTITLSLARLCKTHWQVLQWLYTYSDYSNEASVLLNKQSEAKLSDRV